MTFFISAAPIGDGRRSALSLLEFWDDICTDNAEEITDAIDAITADVCPSSGRRPMYSGIVFEREPGVHKTMVCGHFVYKNHVSLKFGDGYRFSDPESVLEGKGKYRRHIKLTSPGDIESKFVRAMIEQAFSKHMSDP